MQPDGRSEGSHKSKGEKKSENRPGSIKVQRRAEGHRDYDGSADALWTGEGNRPVPEGLRQLAPGQSRNGSGAANFEGRNQGGGDDDEGCDDDGDEDEDAYKGGDHGGIVEAADQRVPLDMDQSAKDGRPREVMVQTHIVAA